MAELLKHLWQNGYQTVALLTDPQSASPVQKIQAEAFEILAAELG